MANANTMQLDISPLLGIFSSIQSSMDQQTSVLRQFVDQQDQQARILQRQSTLQSVTGGIGNALSGLGSAAGGIGASVGGIGSGIGSILGGLGSGLGAAASGLGMGVGVGGLGIGALLAGGGYFLEALEDFDGAKVKENVLELFSISESFSAGMLQFFAEGGLFAAAMTGIGIGLASFGIGSAAAGLADALNNYLGVDNWAQSVKDNVLTLLSIADGVTGNIEFLLESATFAPAMTGLAIGLAAFGVGSGIAGIGEALARFGGGEEWAQNTKNNVLTLLSISDSLGGKAEAFKESGTFLAAMTGIGTGLAIFAAGSAGTGIAELINDDDWAQKIKDDIGILMSIEDSLGGKAEAFSETGMFLAAMTGIGTGLAVFGAGSMITGLTSLINNEDWATKIKTDVLSLLSIADSLPGDDTFIGESSKFFLSMVGIGAGLTAFAAGNFVGTLANAVTAVLSFFGVDSPFEQLMKLADNADELITGATALERITQALDTFASLKISSIEIDFERLATDLGKAVPLLDALANGGEVKGSGGWLTSPLVFEKGILDPSLRLDEMANAISKVNYVLGQTTEMPTSVTTSVTAQGVPDSTVGSETPNLELIMTATAASAAQAAASAAAAAQILAAMSAQSGGSTVTNITTTNISSDPTRSLDPALIGYR